MTARRNRPNRRHARSSRQREHRAHGCWDHLIAAPLWVAYSANLGTLLRSCDAVGACMAVQATSHYRRALDKGDTLQHRPHLHWVRGSPLNWLRREKERGTAIVAVELTERSLPLTLVDPARGRTIVLLGHEGEGVPDEALELAELCIAIPMVGRGVSLNVAVAGSLALYRLAGMV